MFFKCFSIIRPLSYHYFFVTNIWWPLKIFQHRFRKYETLNGENHKARFGMSVASLGNINLDGSTPDNPGGYQGRRQIVFTSVLQFWYRYAQYLAPVIARLFVLDLENIVCIMYWYTVYIDVTANTILKPWSGCRSCMQQWQWGRSMASSVGWPGVHCDAAVKMRDGGAAVTAQSSSSSSPPRHQAATNQETPACPVCPRCPGCSREPEWPQHISGPGPVSCTA